MKIKKILSKIRIKKLSLSFRFLYKVGVYKNLTLLGSVNIVQQLNLMGAGKVNIGSNVQFGVYPSANFSLGEIYIEARTNTSSINIGDNVFINNNATVIADKTSITIGNGTLIGPNFVCFDSNFHPLEPCDRHSDNYLCKPVLIGENVFIGSNVMILQGVTIGNNSVIGAGLVITKDVPSNVIAKHQDNSIKFVELRKY